MDEVSEEAHGHFVPDILLLCRPEANQLMVLASNSQPILPKQTKCISQPPIISPLLRPHYPADGMVRSHFPISCPVKRQGGRCSVESEGMPAKRPNCATSLTVTFNRPKRILSPVSCTRRRQPVDCMCVWPPTFGHCRLRASKAFRQSPIISARGLQFPTRALRHTDGEEVPATLIQLHCQVESDFQKAQEDFEPPD
jgi:hypothetical protein